MKMTKKTSILLIVLILCSTALANRQLERAEILQIFETITSQPKKTWIPSGTIEAMHEEHRTGRITDTNEIDRRIAEEVQAYLADPNKLELTDELQTMRLEAIPFNVRYRLSNEHTMSSNVIVKFDGNRFYWEINVDSRTDSVKPTTDLAGNFLTQEFDLNCNQKRVFAWNGQKYATYFRPVNHAIITDTPSGVNGPMTVGIIPWGYGRYSYANLSIADSNAVETNSGGQTEIQIIVTDGDRQETFILDPAKNYALKCYSVCAGSTLFLLHIYDNYQSIAGNWCPGNILIEKYDMTKNPQKLMTRDIWNFTLVSGDTPEPASFDVTYETDAFIEDFSLGGEPLQYRYPNPELPPLSRVDTDELMMQRFMIASAGSKYAQNCATASLKYVCDRLGLSQSLKNLGRLVNSRQKSTTLLQIQQFAQGLGLNSFALKTDIETLKRLSDYQVIVYLPQRNHFVVLAGVDSEFIRLIDMDNNRFYYRQSLDCFESAWDGTALIVANEPVELKGQFAKIDKSVLQRIVGSGEQCNTLCSSSGESNCQPVGDLCGGTHDIYYSRFCCGCAPSGSCSETSMVYKRSEPCIEDPDSPDISCIGNGDWTSYAMQACE
jgi:hypothetical protein